jgi:steroid delta-isomerase-like uncharacterized protein
MSGKNKETLRRFFEEVHMAGRLDLLPEMCTQDYVNHSPSWPDVVGLDAFKQMLVGVRAALPDLHDTIEDMIAEGDKVVTHWVMSGTHRGEFMGIPATGKRLQVDVVSISHFAGDKVVESWDFVDMLGMLQQMGVLPETFG